MFETKGDKARWKVCYDIVAAAQAGDVITYAEIQDLCSCERGRAQAAMTYANVRLGRDGKNTAETRTNIGWLVLKPEEAVPLIKKQRQKAERADNRTAIRINAAQKRRGELSQIARQEVDHEERVLSRKADIIGRRKTDMRSLAERVGTYEMKPPKELHGP